ncbi:hypothetical protein BJX99DRAFT_249787 [Aspergillus californicus]
MLNPLPASLSAGLLTLSTLFPPSTARYAFNFPQTLHPGPITADFLTPSLDQSDLDAPKFSRANANASSFDWWHFDAISAANPNASVAITFSNAGPVGYPLSFPNVSYLTDNDLTEGTERDNDTESRGSLWAHLWVTFPDGRSFSHDMAVENARMSGAGDSSIAIWHGAGGWMGSEEGYELTLEIPGSGEVVAPEVVVSGRISLERITEPHSPCSTKANFSTSLGLGEEGLGWVSILPDAIATVDIAVNGERLAFDGYGSHDKIWSSHPFTETTKSLTRGRAHLGLYSLLWLSYTPLLQSESEGSGTDTPGEEIVSAFLARDGESVSAGCAPRSVTIRPGTEQTEGGLVSGFQVGIPGAAISVATDVFVQDGIGGDGNGRVGHVRWNGRARGVVDGDEAVAEEDGVAIFERFEY